MDELKIRTAKLRNTELKRRVEEFKADPKAFELSLNALQVTDADMKYIVDEVGSNTRLLILGLKDNVLSHVGLHHLDVLVSINPTLSSVESKHASYSSGGKSYSSTTVYNMVDKILKDPKTLTREDCQIIAKLQGHIICTLMGNPRNCDDLIQNIEGGYEVNGPDGGLEFQGTVTPIPRHAVVAKLAPRFLQVKERAQELGVAFDLFPFMSAVLEQQMSWAASIGKKPTERTGH